ncbi:MAG: chromosome segregation protein SMC [Sphingomonadales bacterium]
MDFTRLRLAGFKSFVDPTELLIEPGLTGVVGPNGCGKSNLLEAIRWVMGENSAKSMRGSGMDDVIFAGTAGRPQRNLAEVGLFLDNASRTAPAAFNDELHLEVVRRIERESGSAYRLNGRDVRAKDVQLLFADMATGAHSPALVSQGRIGALISAKPRDRRAILEEAAGISGLHARRNEAERRLRAAETNLTRVSDVIQQIESQITSLRRQARQAERYRTVSARIRQHEAVLLYLKWRHAAEQLQATEARLHEWDGRVADITGEAGKLSAEQGRLAATLPELRNTQAERGAALHRLAVAHDSLIKEEKQILDTRSRLAAQLDQVAQDMAREQALVADTEGAVTRLTAERDDLDRANGGQNDARKKAAEAVEAASRAASEQERALDEVRAEAARAEAERNRLTQSINGAESRALRLSREADTARQQLAGMEAGDAVLARAEKLAEEIRTATDEAHETRQHIDDARATVEARRTAELVARENLEAARTALARIESERDTLVRLMGTPGTGTAPIAEAITVTPGFEAALGAALGDDLDAPVNPAAAAHWSELPAYAAQPSLPTHARPLSELVAAPAALARRLAFIGVVESPPTQADLDALQPGQRLVSVDGALWRWDGFAAAADAPTGAAERLARKNRLTEIEGSRERAESDHHTARTTHQATRNQLEQAIAAERVCETTLKTTEARRADLQSQLSEIERRAAGEAARRTTLREAIARLERDQAEALTEKSSAEAALGELAPTNDLTARGETLKADVDKRRLRLAEARAAHDTLAAQARHRKQRLEAINRELDAWQLRLDSATGQIAALGAREQDARAELDAVSDRPRQIAAERARLTDQIEIAETARREAADTLATAETRVAEADRALREVNSRLGDTREEKVRIETALEQMLERRRDIARSIVDAFEVPPQRVLAHVGVEEEDADLPTMDATEETLDTLKRERERLGAVNLRADIELQDLEVQFQSLTTDRADLEAAIARLRQAIGSLNREGRERLLAAFEDVNDHFGALFRTLFGGGHAYLTLTESDDPLDAGLEIMASPPGKKLQVLSLLSGGEQALTALSLIFAVFITNPAPICVLDEVDAPLDDANVERFCDLLDEMVRRTRTRFLIVTHNAVTMSRMNRLFGVTMVERGISRLVSVDLEEAERLRAVG